MGEVVNLPCITTLNLPPERVLEGALKADLAGVVVLGYTKDGEPYFASTYADGGDVMWLMELCKRMLLDTAERIHRDGR
jgi:hypothetical protein